MSPALEQNRLFLTIGLVPRQMRRNLQNTAIFETDPTNPAQAWVTGVRYTVDNCQVCALRAMRLELSRQSLMGNVVFGDY